MPAHTTQFFVDLESRVWDTQVSGDPQAQHELLSADFLGVYPSGFANRTEHAEQLSDGPITTSYSIVDARLIEVSESSVLLCYRADHQPSGQDETESMFISSLWVERDGRWRNTFSQDSPVGP
ncbi:nuclear transport factor 2 family protein [Promicromonospora sp. NPDC023805]|uniref:nuclear transport factor 2 family protein n=1 Tax=Promicromonospora sp. NPDC023805 TaxID=3154696 RepID=UPI0033DD7FB0